MKKLLATLSIISICSSVSASELKFQFGNPSFSGNSKSTHYLTIENIEKTRKDAIEAKRIADAKALKDELNSTAIAKFKANLEARFYTALAKQITDNVFGSDGLQQDSGTYTAQNGEIITWSTVTSGDNAGVTVTVNDTANGNGTVTYTLPYQDNQ
tara:strand:- start:320 stop:787 length:468 start_codon:yes stop_codon:yes gene_type:complete